jgi:hypothetical protein
VWPPQVDFHMVIDLLPVLTRLFFLGRLPSDVSLSRLQVRFRAALTH